MKQNLLTPEMQKDFRAKLTKAFRAFRKAGYYARQNYWCCQTCAWADIPEAMTNNVVFYHHQDNEDIPTGYVYLAWAGDGEFIVRTLNAAGLKASWAAINSSRIKVLYE